MCKWCEANKTRDLTYEQFNEMCNDTDNMCESCKKIIALNIAEYLTEKDVDKFMTHNKELIDSLR